MSKHVLISIVMGYLIIGSGFSISAAAGGSAEGWATPVPPAPSAEQRAKFGFKPLDYQTTFYENMAGGKFAAINNQTAIGVPGTVPLPFSYVTRVRYSEFDMAFKMETDKGEAWPYILPNFKQTLPNGWMPGCITDWDYDGVHYQLSVIMVPNDPQPIDMYKIVITNTSQKQVTARLSLTIDSAPTTKIENTLISDRSKPLIVMEPAVPVQKIWRDSGCVDPRTNASAPWDFAMSTDRWIRHRDSYYGMPLEYMLKPKNGQSLQIFLGYGGIPNITTPNWDEPYERMDPFIRDLMTPKQRAVVAQVEGDPTPQAVTLERRKHVIQKFVGKDIDGDGYIKVSVRATPESRQPGMLSWIYAYDMNAKVAQQDLFDDPTDIKGFSGQFLPGPGQPGLEARTLGADTGNVKAMYRIDVGGDFFVSPDAQRTQTGTDPTVYALKLAYTPTLAPGEQKSYLLKLPAIDRPEPACYGNPGHPYDTKESWKPFLEPRYPNNKAAYGEDVPPGINPAEYAVNGPKHQRVWQKQLVAAQKMTWQQGMQKLTNFWDNFAADRAEFFTPESVLDNMFKHQLAILSLYRLQFSPSKILCVWEVRGGTGICRQPETFLMLYRRGKWQAIPK
jgi:hypothetical protein